MEKNKFQNENNGNNNVNNAQPTNTQKAVAVLKAIETGDQSPHCLHQCRQLQTTQPHRWRWTSRLRCRSCWPCRLSRKAQSEHRSRF